MKTKKLFSIICAVAIATGLSTVAKADTNNDTIVITATRTEAKALTTSSQVNVITSKQIKEKGITFIQNALKYVPGISTASNGAFGGQTTIYMRGLGNGYISTLLDGVQIYDTTGTKQSINYSNFFGSDVSRIEIVQGSQSGLYGSNAIAGVINIITKKGKGKPHFSLSQQIGSFNTFKETTTFSGERNNLSFFIQAVRFDTKGISKTDKKNPDGSYSKGDEKDSYHKTALFTRFEHSTIHRKAKFGIILKVSHTRNYLDYYAGSYPNDNDQSNTTPTGKSYRENVDFLFAKTYSKIKLNNILIKPSVYFFKNYRYQYSIPSNWYNKFFKSRLWGTINTITIKPLKGTLLTTGGEFRRESAFVGDYPNSNSGGFKKLKNNWAFFGELQQKISYLNIQATAREDHFQTFGNHFTYKIGINYLVTKTNTILKANYGTGFRAPSMYELYSSYGNPDLKPEKSKSWSFGFSQFLLKNTNKVSLEITYFKNIVKNRIGWSGSSYNQIPGKTVNNGIEYFLKAKPFNFLETGLNYTYTKSKNPDTGKQTARIPLRVYTGYITVKALNNKLTATVDGRYIGKRYNDNNHTHQTGKYAVFDFTALYKPTKRLELSLTVKNIFNRFYEEVYGYSTLPRSAFATVSYTF